MRKLIVLSLGLIMIVPAQAQLLSRESLGGAAIGALAGGLIGHGAGRHGWEGAAIGAGTGLLLGTAAREAQREQAYYYSAAYYPGQTVYYSRPNYAVGGAAVGALAGGLIGHGVGKHGWEGAAIGAGTGLVLGSVAEENARRSEAAYYSAPPVGYYANPSYRASGEATTPTPAAVPQPASQPVTVINNNSSPSPMSSANSLFGR